MLTLAFILVILWLVGVLTAYTFGGLLHLLVGIAAILFITRLFRRKSVA